MDKRLRGAMFDALKSALRARGWTYSDLADALGLSEPTIKRMFADGDCKLGRLLAICDLLDLTLTDLTDRARRTTDSYLELSEEGEAELAANPWLFDLYVLLQSGETPERIGEAHQVPVHRLHEDLHRLYRLGLATLGEDGRFRVRMDQPLRLPRHGPLHARIRSINLRFMASIYDTPDAEDQLFRTISRRMLPDTARIVRQELVELAERIDKLARQDRLIAPSRTLSSWKFSFVLGPANFPELLDDTSEAAGAPSPEQVGRAAL